MINILSCNGKLFRGKEIKEWIEYHSLNQTEYSKIARSMLRYRNLDEDRFYRINLRPASTAGGGKVTRSRPNVIVVTFDSERELYG